MTIFCHFMCWWKPDLDCLTLEYSLSAVCPVSPPCLCLRSECDTAPCLSSALHSGVDISGLAVIIFNQNGINIPYQRTSAREQPHQHCCPTIHTRHSPAYLGIVHAPHRKLNSPSSGDVNEHSQSFTQSLLLVLS